MFPSLRLRMSVLKLTAGDYIGESQDKQDSEPEYASGRGKPDERRRVAKTHKDHDDKRDFDSGDRESDNHVETAKRDMGGPKREPQQDKERQPDKTVLSPNRVCLRANERPMR